MASKDNSSTASRPLLDVLNPAQLSLAGGSNTGFPSGTMSAPSSNNRTELSSISPNLQEIANILKQAMDLVGNDDFADLLPAMKKSNK